MSIHSNISNIYRERGLVKSRPYFQIRLILNLLDPSSNRDKQEIKRKISEMSEMSEITEYFILPQINEENIDEEVKEILENENILAMELYAVVDDFDKSPDKLSVKQKDLRKKYLTIILSIINKGIDYVENLFDMFKKLSKDSEDLEIISEQLDQNINTIMMNVVKSSSEFKKAIQLEIETLNTIINNERNKKITEIDIQKMRLQIKEVEALVKEGGIELEPQFKNLNILISDLEVIKSSRIKPKDTEKTIPNTIRPLDRLKEILTVMSRLKDINSNLQNPDQIFDEKITEITRQIQELINKKIIQITDLEQIKKNIVNLSEKADRLKSKLALPKQVTENIAEANEIIDTLKDDQVGLANYDASVNTIKRIIKLLIMEIDTGNTSVPSPCVLFPCNEKKYMTSTVILSIILGIIGIIIVIIMSFFRTKS
jgi:hypothetical protein